MRTLLALSFVLSLPALADDVEVELVQNALRGQGLPAVKVHVLSPIAGFRLLLTRSDGKKVDLKGGGRPGTVRTLDLEQPEGTFSWKGELQVNGTRGTTDSMPLEFETTVLGKLYFTCDKDKDVDLAGRRLRFKLSNPAGKARLRVLMDTGQYAIDGEINFNGEPGGTPLEVTWPEAPGEVMSVDLRAYDTAGFYDGVVLTPWQIDIPHEEAKFESGKWDLRAEDQPKLDKSYQLIADAVAKYGRLADLRLYVAGHTDTVGSNASNLTLSLNRAKAIGGYFRKKGLRLPIYYEGFGEEAPQVVTPDETDELRNRRAEYIIAIDDPKAKNTGYVAKWKKL